MRRKIRYYGRVYLQWARLHAPIWVCRIIGNPGRWHYVQRSAKKGIGLPESLRDSLPISYNDHLMVMERI